MIQPEEAPKSKSFSKDLLMLLIAIVGIVLVAIIVNSIL
jgi:uncharacterized protein involved in exopolysaccharide biosynthesis